MNTLTGTANKLEQMKYINTTKLINNMSNTIGKTLDSIGEAMVKVVVDNTLITQDRYDEFVEATEKLNPLNKRNWRAGITRIAKQFGHGEKTIEPVCKQWLRYKIEFACISMIDEQRYEALKSIAK